MNFTKKLALGASTLLLASTLASAQSTINPTGEVPFTAESTIDFQVTVERIAELTVTPSALGTLTGGVNDAGTLLMTTAIAQEPSVTSLLTIMQNAGTALVKTNLGTWDVILVAANGGWLYQDDDVSTTPGSVFTEPTTTVVPGHYLKANGIMTQLQDAEAKLEVGVCFEAGPTATTCTAPTARLSSFLNGTPNQEISLATVLGKGTAKFRSSDLTSSEGIFTIFARLPFTEDELDGNGIYKESFTFMLVDGTY